LFDRTELLGLVDCEWVNQDAASSSRLIYLCAGIRQRCSAQLVCLGFGDSGANGRQAARIEDAGQLRDSAVVKSG